MTTLGPDAAAIAWLESEEGQALFPLDLGGATLHYDQLVGHFLRWWLDYGDGDGWRFLSDPEALALVEHALRRKLEKPGWDIDISRIADESIWEIVLVGPVDTPPGSPHRNCTECREASREKHVVEAPIFVQALAEMMEAVDAQEATQ